MTGIVFDIKRGSVKDGPGIRTSVFLKGCPLRCVWCHNPESQNPAPEPMGGVTCGREMTVEDVMSEVRADRIFYAKSGGGLTLTGGEPLAQPAFARALATAAKAEGIPVALDTCGAVPWEAMEPMLVVTDLFLFDFKATPSERHRELTGLGSGEILANLAQLDAAGARIVLRCPLVPGLNDTPEHLDAVAGLAEGLRGIEEVTLLPYHPIGVDKYAGLGRYAPYAGRGFPSPEDIVCWRERVSAGTSKRVVVA